QAATIAVNQGSGGVLTVGAIGGTHNYANRGSYTVTVSVQDDDGGTATGTFVVTTGAKFLVVDQWEHSVFQYNPSLGFLNETSLATANTQPRGITADVAGQKYWVVDSNGRVYVYDRAQIADDEGYCDDDGHGLLDWVGGILAALLGNHYDHNDNSHAAV